jgi:hypothetical protein
MDVLDVLDSYVVRRVRVAIATGVMASAGKAMENVG